MEILEVRSAWVILDRVKLRIRRFVRWAFRDILDVDAVRHSWDEGHELRCEEERSSYLALDNSKCAKQRVTTDRLCGHFR